MVGTASKDLAKDNSMRRSSNRAGQRHVNRGTHRSSNTVKDSNGFAGHGSVVGFEGAAYRAHKEIRLQQKRPAIHLASKSGVHWSTLGELTSSIASVWPFCQPCSDFSHTLHGATSNWSISVRHSHRLAWQHSNAAVHSSNKQTSRRKWDDRQMMADRVVSPVCL